VPRACTVCTNVKRREIDRALVQGAPTVREMSRRYGLSETALKRHRAEHLPSSLARANAVKEVALADDLLGQVRYLQQRSLALLATAERVGDLRSAGAAIGQARGCIELQAKLLGELDDRPQVSVQLGLSPEWLAVRVALMEALAPFPEARQAVAQRLLALQAGTAPADGESAISIPTGMDMRGPR
jgi:transposase-like protein